LWPEWFQAPRQLAAWWLNYLNIAVAEFFEHFSPSLAELFERRHVSRALVNGHVFVSKSHTG